MVCYTAICHTAIFVNCNLNQLISYHCIQKSAYHAINRIGITNSTGRHNIKLLVIICITKIFIYPYCLVQAGRQNPIWVRIVIDRSDLSLTVCKRLKYGGVACYIPNLYLKWGGIGIACCNYILIFYDVHADYLWSVSKICLNSVSQVCICSSLKCINI